MMTTIDTLSISDAAQPIGVSAYTLRYNERAGLMLDPVGRPSSSHRRCTEDDIGVGCLSDNAAQDGHADPAHAPVRRPRPLRPR
ncbi:MAG TPA: MerR family transcriptional regulator [Actinomycetes bacterium]|jgi:hypothetical protein|nr:MerR family transcriptional regulator [Actinomycetes bacterium]